MGNVHNVPPTTQKNDQWKLVDTDGIERSGRVESLDIIHQFIIQQPEVSFYSNSGETGIYLNDELCASIFAIKGKGLILYRRCDGKMLVGERSRQGTLTGYHGGEPFQIKSKFIVSRSTCSHAIKRLITGVEHAENMTEEWEGNAFQ